MPSAARGSLVGTISLPIGAMATAASLKLPIPSGMPTMVRQSNAPSIRWASAIQRPTRMNQRAFPIVEAAPASGLSHHRSAKGPKDEGGESEGGDPKRDRDDQRTHHDAGKRVADCEPKTGEDEPKQVQNRAHDVSLSLWSTTCTARRADRRDRRSRICGRRPEARRASFGLRWNTRAVAYDEDLADRLREILYGEEGLTELRMFGGLAFLINGHMAVSASGQGGLLLRVDPADPRDLASRAGAQSFVMRGRAMEGWLRVARKLSGPGGSSKAGRRSASHTPARCRRRPRRRVVGACAP